MVLDNNGHLRYSGRTMKILGFRTVRIREWLRVVRDEGRRVGPWAATRAMATTLTGGTVSAAVFRARMRACAACPVYDSSRKACRDRAGRGLGCGCYMPFKASFRGPQCWARSVMPDGQFGHLE